MLANLKSGDINPLFLQSTADASEPSACFGRCQAPNVFMMSAPKMSEWRCDLFGTPDICLHPRKGNEPNWFWRWMQFLAFGNRWYRIPKKDVTQ